MPGSPSRVTNQSLKDLRKIHTEAVVKLTQAQKNLSRTVSYGLPQGDRDAATTTLYNARKMEETAKENLANAERTSHGSKSHGSKRGGGIFLVGKK